KSEFLANMSHELRTPLNSLLILARLLTDNAEKNMTAKQIEFAHTIYTAGADLLSLINDILDLAKIESGTVTLNIGTERFSEISDYVERTFRQVARDKNLEFRIELDPALPPGMETDGKRVQQVIKNLLSNAFKFTDKGEVTMRIAPAESGWHESNSALNAAGKVISISVSDTGIGIPANKQRIIFEAFQQADGTTSREYGGTGLGLSISRELARLLGGEIRVASTPGSGSVFTLYLPVDYREPSPTAQAIAERLERRHHPRADEPRGRKEEPRERRDESLERHPRAEQPAESFTVAAESEPPARDVAEKAIAGLSGKKALLVDDDIRNVFALTSALEQHGLTVIHADNGREGIETLKRTGDIDFVLMDLMMPGLDGYDTIRFIRRLESYAKLPIVAVTAKAMIGDREKCIEAGATDYIAKPVNVDTLMTIVWKCMQT
ncbi:MAG TPA: ATP-binding protein, partial [Burkholderiales bacterium]|nr:ATP-binding protein [Burkholderiales bacterium]